MRRRMLTALLIFSLGVIIRAEDGLVVVKRTTLYKGSSLDRSAHIVVAELKPGDVMLPAPDNSRADHTLTTTCFSFKRCGVSFNENLDPERYHVLAFLETSSDRRKWHNGWVDKSSVQRFTYEPRFIQVQCPGNISYDVLEGESFLKPAFLKLDELAFKDFVPPEIDNTRRFEKPFTDVWSAIIEVLAANHIPFQLIDKDSGLLTTRPIRDPLTNTMVCATTFDEGNKVAFNVFAKDEGEATTIRINASFTALRDDSPIECHSNGTLESWLLDNIAKTLGGG